MKETDNEKINKTEEKVAKLLEEFVQQKEHLERNHKNQPKKEKRMFNKFWSFLHGAIIIGAIAGAIWYCFIR